MTFRKEGEDIPVSVLKKSGGCRYQKIQISRRVREWVCERYIDRERELARESEWSLKANPDKKALRGGKKPTPGFSKG